VEGCFSLGRDVIGWKQSKTTRQTVREKIIVRQFALANNAILTGTDPELDNVNTEHNSETMQQAEERKLHRIDKVHDLVEIWHGSNCLCIPQMESRAKNKQMTAVGYISDTEEIGKVSWSVFQHDGAAAFKLSQRSPLPPLCFAKDLPGGRSQIINDHRI
jgi:hypothetical protein